MKTAHEDQDACCAARVRGEAANSGGLETLNAVSRGSEIERYLCGPRVFSRSPSIATQACGLWDC
jgi:hypothetical protein